MNTDATVQEVRIADLVQHKAFQVRKKRDAATIKRYAQQYALDGPIAYAPILVGRIVSPDRAARGRPNERLARDCPPGALVLLAGYHRVAACQNIGKETILARIVDITAREAQWRAAESNMAHGLPLKSAEWRQAFYAYLRAGKHRNADGSIKSLREIGRLFGKHHETIRAWMNTPEFKNLFNMYGPKDARPEYPEQQPDSEPHPEEGPVMTTEEALRMARNISPALNADQRERLLRALELTRQVLAGEVQGEERVAEFAT